MKTLIVGINSKYVHSCLAIWYLKAACSTQCGQVEAVEFSINDPVSNILMDIYAKNPDVVAFSTYIWNVAHVLNIARNIKNLKKNVYIVLGGPEVSFESKEIMQKFSFVDYILKGEGEINFPLLLKAINEQKQGRNADIYLNKIKGILYKSHGHIIEKGEYALVEDLDAIPSPYTEDMLSAMRGKVVYFESSRGCPFSCSYCLSSTFQGVRYFSIERVEKELDKLINNGFKKIKFVDRTFNASIKRAEQILKLIFEKYSHHENLNFHFEIGADLLNERLVSLLSLFPKGLVQFEAGIQTTNEKTLQLISRKTDTQKILNNLSSIISLDNIHVHVDLITGLPQEDLQSFIKSFNDVYSLKAHKIQLGFLKLLKGSSIRNNKHEFGYIYDHNPPYEVYESKWMKFDDFIILKRIEELIERLYNSKKFTQSLNFFEIKYLNNYFQMFEQLSEFAMEEGFYDSPSSQHGNAILLKKFAKKILNEIDYEDFMQLLAFDWMSTNVARNLPEEIFEEKIFNFDPDKIFEFLKDNKNIEKYFPHLRHLRAKEIYKHINMNVFSFNNMENILKISSIFNSQNNYCHNQFIVLFDYSSKNTVTGRYDYKIINVNQMYIR